MVMHETTLYSSTVAVRHTIIITRVSGQVHCAYSCKSTLVQDKQDTTRRPVT
jgi:hypothetical protein